jgi:hypothetical protein
MEHTGETATAVKVEPPPTGGTRLYSARQVLVATILGSPVAGGILVAFNYRRWGERRSAWMALLAGGAALAGLLAIGALLPSGPGHSSTMLPVAGALGFQAGADALQGARVKAHVAGGGRVESWWRTVGWGVGVLVAVLAVATAVVLLVPGLL